MSLEISESSKEITIESLEVGRKVKRKDSQEDTASKKPRLESTGYSVEEKKGCQQCRSKTLSTHITSFLTNIAHDKLFPKPKKSLSEPDLARVTRSQVQKDEQKDEDDIPRTYSFRPVRISSYSLDPFHVTIPKKAQSLEMPSIKSPETRVLNATKKPVVNTKEPKRILAKNIGSLMNRSKEPCPIKGKIIYYESTRSKLNRIEMERGQIQEKDLVIGTHLLGEGQTSVVYKATHKGLEVACKTSRFHHLHESEPKIKRELYFSAKLYTCRFVNRYVGWIQCHPNQLMTEETLKNYTQDSKQIKETLFVVQRYFPYGDGRTYFQSRKSLIHPFEILNVAICLFSALTDAHSLGVGFVDLKLENLLIDSAGSAWLTDFESCIEFKDQTEVNLTDEVSWTVGVAAPEMIDRSMFCKSSDVFMALVILSELMTATTSDEMFEKRVLQRHPDNGSVNFVTNYLSKQYENFFPLLGKGLDNNPSSRPTAENCLKYLLKMKRF